jgi:CRP-like cAMP-binding protein
VALTDVRLSRVDGGAVLRALRRTRRTLPLLVHELQQETERARRAAAGAGGLAAAERLAMVLLDLRDRFAGPEGWLPEGIPHRVLGELAGVHRSTVTTQLNAWIYEGVLRQQGRRVRIAKPGALPGTTSGGGVDGSR